PRCSVLPSTTLFRSLCLQLLPYAGNLCLQCPDLGRIVVEIGLQALELRFVARLHCLELGGKARVRGSLGRGVENSVLLLEIQYRSEEHTSELQSREN